MKRSEKLAAERRAKWLSKKVKKGARSFPVGTLAFYGPDDRRATKVVASIVPGLDTDPTEMKRWFAAEGDGDLRASRQVLDEVADFFREHGVSSVRSMPGVFGCPHEEGIDYPEGEACPQCPFWDGVDRYARLGVGPG